MANGTPHPRVQLSMSGFLSPPRKREVIDLLTSDEDNSGTNAPASNVTRSVLNCIPSSANGPSDAQNHVDDILQQPMHALESSQEVCDRPQQVKYAAANGPMSLNGDSNGALPISKPISRTIENPEDSDGAEESEEGERADFDLMQSTRHAAERQEVMHVSFEPSMSEKLPLNPPINKETSDDESDSDDESSTSPSRSVRRPDPSIFHEGVNAIDGNGVDELEGSEHEDNEDEMDAEMLEDVFVQLTDEINADINEEELTDEAHDLIHALRRDGIQEFVHHNLESGLYTADRICALFGCPLSDLLKEMDNFDDLALNILGKLLMREISRRRKLPQYNTIDDAATLLKNSRRILVLTGAGISTSLGIPDFRSSNGLYAQLAASGLADKVDDPQDVFSLSVFREDPAIFYTVARSILSSDRRFSPTHQFIRLIQDKGKLQTNFTQNIDNLEAAAGIEPDKLIHCHGSFATATCQGCGHNITGDNIHDEIRAGAVPRCPRCLAQLRKLRAASQLGMKRKRSTTSIKARKSKPNLAEWEEDDTEDEAEDLSDDAAGVMKPDIIFFGEDLSDAFHNRAIDDKKVVDLVVVIGTSLKVAPVSEVPNFIPSEVPQIYISRDPCRHIVFDIQLLGECDVVVAELCKRADWELRHEMVPEGGYDVEVREVEGRPGRNVVQRRLSDEKA